MTKKILLAVLLLLILIAISFWDLITYGIGQAKGQFNIIQKARPISELLEESEFPDSLKQKIRIIDEVRTYAMDSIGLVNSDNYTTFYDQKGKVILWNLSACEPYNLAAKTWRFPFLGSFPYKGFFELEKAKKEEMALKDEGYDTRIRSVSGWSTLGWFNDPILSNMLDRSEGRLADLIIHELTHATLFVKDDIEFNENLASFIGQRGALQFLKAKYGKNSSNLEAFQNTLHDNRKYTKHMLYCTELLNNLYNSFSEEGPDSTKYMQKHLLIDEIISSLDTLEFYNEKYYDVFKKKRPNNAYFMSFVRYHSSEDSLMTIYNDQYNSCLTDFIKGMKHFHESS